MTEERATLASPGHVRPPTDGLSNALWSRLLEAEHGSEAPFSTRDLCLTAAVALLAQGKRASVPPEYAPIVTGLLAELGLPGDASDEQIQKTVAAELKDRPIDHRLLEALEGFRTGGLEAAIRESRSEKGAELLGAARRPSRAPSVEDKPKLTAQQLLHRRSTGKTIIR